jgi:hypothetical protein
MAPPLDLLDTTMYSFLVPADYGALVSMIDAQLNAACAGTNVVYKPLLPMAAIVCADVTKSFSTTPPDSMKGWNAERDFGVWIPVVSGTQDGSTWKPGRIGWYLPYVFVDNVAAMVTGREVYGFFKQQATLACPPKPSAPGMFSIDALVIPRYTPDSQAENLRLMTLTSTEGNAAPSGMWQTAADALEALWSGIKGAFYDNAYQNYPLPFTAWDLLKNALEDLVTGDVPMVFLKQFRDCAVPATACYQAVIEAPAKLNKFYEGWFTHPHDIVIAEYDSHPIVKECGLAGPKLRSEVGFWCRMDFTMQPGKVIAQQ